MLLQENETVSSPRASYQVQGKIGSESTFGAVFKALDGEGRPVVIKQLLGSGRIVQDTGMDYSYARKTFRQEAEILMSHNHPRIVRGYDFFERDEDLFLVMEFINGEDLDQVLIKKLEQDGGQPFSEEEASAIGYSLCGVIHAIHQLPGQVLYRDLKPRNVMWDAVNRTLKLIDFGTARFSAGDARPTQALGTPGYAPPEFYSTAKPLSFASDVYTIGATLFELVTGEPPEPLMTPTHFHGYENRLSLPFRNVVAKAMAQKPRDRFQTAEQMGQALRSLDSFSDRLLLPSQVKNPYPYLSCLCPRCGAQPLSGESVFCASCGEKIHVVTLRILPANGEGPAMDLFLDKKENHIGRTDMDEEIFPDIDLSRYDPECYVSRRHCILRRRGTRFFLESLKTTNETAINGHPLAPGRAVELLPGAELELANLRVHFSIKPCMSSD